MEIDANSISFFPQNFQWSGSNHLLVLKDYLPVWEIIQESGYTFEVCNRYTTLEIIVVLLDLVTDNLVIVLYDCPIIIKWS